LRAVKQLNRLISPQAAFDKRMKKPEYNQTGEYRRPDCHACYKDAAVHINSICFHAKFRTLEIIFVHFVAKFLGTNRLPDSW
jgi:hypothetical protein